MPLLHMIDLINPASWRLKFMRSGVKMARGLLGPGGGAGGSCEGHKKSVMMAEAAVVLSASPTFLPANLRLPCWRDARYCHNTERVFTIWGWEFSV